MVHDAASFVQLLVCSFAGSWLSTTCCVCPPLWPQWYVVCFACLEVFLYCTKGNGVITPFRVALCLRSWPLYVFCYYAYGFIKRKGCMGADVR
jgi:hypothetical protein